MVTQAAVKIEAVDRGCAFGRLDPDVPADGAAVLALAQRSSQAALAGAVASGAFTQVPAKAELRYVTHPERATQAAAAIELEIVDDFVDALWREGRITARVNVAVIDEDGEHVARGRFEWVVLRRS